MKRGRHGEVSGFQTIATCRDCLKKSRDKSANKPVCVVLMEFGNEHEDTTNGETDFRTSLHARPCGDQSRIS